MKKSKIFMYIVTIFLFVIAITLLVLFTAPVNNAYQVDCGASYRRKSENIDAKLLIRMTLDKNNRGSIFFSGKAYMADSKEFFIERWFHFNYKKVGANRIVMDNFRMQKRDADNVPDDIFKNIAWSVGTTSINFEISKFKNSYIISNPFSPLMVCIKRKMH